VTLGPWPLGQWAVERITTLREQATVLRTLAGSFDIQTIRDQLLDLATRCDELAGSLEANGPAGRVEPAGPARR
jgi:hypothetical protein